MKKLIALLLIASMILCGCGASTPAATEATTAPSCWSLLKPFMILKKRGN